MRLIALAGYLLWLLTGPSLAGGTIEISQSVESPALARSLRYSLYLPENTTPPPPVLYLLHGLGGNERDWVTLGKIKETADRMIAERAIPPLAIVMPAGGNSWYVNSPTHGAVETAYLQDLMPTIEARHHLRSDRGGRFVAGLSMGGYGALRLAILHPDKFRAAASLSGAIFPDLGPLNRPGAARGLSQGQVRMFKGAFGQPFSPDVYNRSNFFSQLANFKASNQRVDLFISVGDDDGFRLYEGAVDLYLALKRRRLPVEMRIVDGDHNWRLWRRDIIPALRFVGQVLRTDTKSGADEGDVKPAGN